MDCSPPGSSVHGDSPGKNTGVGCHALPQGIFPTRGSNLRSLQWLAGSLPLAPPGKPQQSFQKIVSLKGTDSNGGRGSQAEGNQGRNVLRAGSQFLLQYLDVKGVQGLRKHQACPLGAHSLAEIRTCSVVGLEEMF